MASALDYNRYYTFLEASQAIGVSLAWVERHVGNAMKTGLIANLGTKAEPCVRGADLKTICMKRWSELETEHRWRAFERVRAREQGREEAEEEIL